MNDTERPAGSADYLFRVRFRVEPDDDGVSLEPSRFETTLSRAAAPPGEAGWLFFRDNLWRGELNATDHVREVLEADLGLPIETVEFRELRTDSVYLDTLKEAIAADLERFRAADVPEVLTKYLGSRIHVRE